MRPTIVKNPKAGAAPATKINKSHLSRGFCSAAFSFTNPGSTTQSITRQWILFLSSPCFLIFPSIMAYLKIPHLPTVAFIRYGKKGC